MPYETYMVNHRIISPILPSPVLIDTYLQLLSWKDFIDKSMDGLLRQYKGLAFAAVGGWYAP